MTIYVVQDLKASVMEYSAHLQASSDTQREIDQCEEEIKAGERDMEGCDEQLSEVTDKVCYSMLCIVLYSIVYVQTMYMTALTLTLAGLFL